jgi:diguanylate cyclase (GGDEF)-like protein
MDALFIQRRLLPLLFVLGLWSSVSVAYALERALEVSALADAPISLTDHFEILEDRTGKLGIADVVANQQFTSGQAPAWSLKFGVTPFAYWLKLDLNNSSAKPVEAMMEFMYPRLASSVQLFTPNDAGAYDVVNTGYLRPFSERPYKHHFYVFPLSVKPGTQSTVYMRFQSEVNLEIPGRLWQRDAFHQYERMDYMSHAAYFGMLIGMMGFNFLLYLSLRSRRYLLYVCYCIGLALSFASFNGLGVEYLWGDSPYWVNTATGVGFCVTMALGILFMRSMIEIRKLVPRLDRALRAAIVVNLLLALGIALAYGYFIKLQLAVLGLSSLLILVTGIWCAILRDRSAVYFTAAFAVIGLGGMANSLRALGVIESSFFSIYGLQLGSALEMVLLAFALADRYNEIRKEKEQAQKETLQAQQQVVESLQSSEKLLEARVHQRTEELRLLNARLETLSATDGLTGLANRRQFDEVLDSEWRRAQRMRQPMAIGILDVDRFKQYNDLYGHLAGDVCLKTVAEVLMAHIGRSGDLAARYGGEEFAFIAIGVDQDGALALAQKICDALSACAMPHRGSEFGHVTASVGVSSMVPDEGTPPLTLVKAADDALYQAKEQGRNMVRYLPQS